MTVATDPTAAAYRNAYEVSQGMLSRNLDGITGQQAEERPRPELNNVVWLIGHIAYWRHELANAARIPGADDLPDISRFRGVVWGRPADTSGWSLQDVIGLADSGLARVKEGFAAVGGGEPGEFMEQVGVLAVHEAYTVGQVAVLRRLLGLEGAIRGKA
jgi:hypothetical protein